MNCKILNDKIIQYTTNKSLQIHENVQIAPHNANLPPPHSSDRQLHADAGCHELQRLPSNQHHFRCHSGLFPLRVEQDVSP